MFYDEDDPRENWRAKSKCIGHDPELWFPPRDKTKYKVIADKAKSICFGRDGMPECPVRVTCLLYADDRDETFGIWGGMSHRERNALSRKAARHGKTLREWVTDGKQTR